MHTFLVDVLWIVGHDHSRQGWSRVSVLATDALDAELAATQLVMAAQDVMATASSVLI